MELEKQIAIIQAALGIYPQLGQRFCNPLRVDNQGDCYFELRSGYLRLVDWADRRYHNMNCFDILASARGIDTGTAIKLAGDIVGKWDVTAKPDTVESDSFKVDLVHESAPLRPQEVDYLSQWFQLGGAESWYGSWACPYYKHNTKRTPKLYYSDTPEDPCFVYRFISGNIKIYRPLAPDKRDKFRTNSDENDLYFDFMPQGHDDLIWTKSWKDGSILHDMTRVDVRATTGEAVLPKLVPISPLLKRYRRIFVLYDADKAGFRETGRVTEHLRKVHKQVIPVYWPQSVFRSNITDVAEYYSAEGRDKTLSQLKSMFSEALRKRRSL